MVPVSLERTQLRKSQMEEMHVAREGEGEEGGHRAHMPSPDTSPAQHTHVFTHLEAA